MQQDKAKEFLDDFLLKLAASDQTNRQLLEVQAASFHVAQQNLQLQQQLVEQLAELSLRIKILDKQMATLSKVLVADDPPLQYPAPLQPPLQPPTMGQFIGGALGYGLDQMTQGGGGRRQR